jgi:kumamolisin
MPDEAVLTVWLAPPQPAFAAERAVSLGSKPIAERTYLTRAELRSAGDAEAGVRAGAAALFEVPGIRRIEHVWRRIVVRGAAHACAEAVRALRASPFGRHVVTIFGPETTGRVQSFAHVSRANVSAGRRPSEIARAYRMPAGLDGSGTSIGVLHFSGTFHASDFERAMREARVEPPRYVERGAARPSSEADDFEIALDTQVAGAVAPRATLVLYRGADDARGYADTIAEALLDEVDAPQVLSISYGDPENQWSPGAVRVIDQLFIAAALCGITVVVASGDRGSAMAEREPHVMFPASDPHALACGGTNLRLERGRRLSEHVWQEAGGASGGGYSRVFGRPAWHAAGERAAGRGVPDVAAHAASETGYRIVVRGKPYVAGGTSAVAPLWAGFVALVNQRLGMPCGFFTPRLYRYAPPGAFHDITMGTNGHYHARTGWDPCTGLGSPNFSELLNFFIAGG